MRARRLFAVITVAAATCFHAGCALLLIGGAGAAGYAYVNGECEKFYPYAMDQTWAAVRDAVQSMGLPVVREASDALSGRLESRTAEGDKVTITLKPKGAVTDVRIRVGVFGDEDESGLILAEIDKRLPGPYPAPPPRPDVHVGVSVSR